MKLKFVLQPANDLNKFCGHRVWQKPKDGHVYAIGADVAEGVGGDASCSQVFDCTTGLHVASFWSNLIDTDNYAAELYKQGSWYNTAFICIEANNHGHSVISNLSGAIGGLTYPNLYKRIEYDEYTQRRTKKIGFVTKDRNHKARLIDNLKSALKSGEIVTFDKYTIQDLGNFVRDEKSGRLGASGSAHDDRVMALGLAWEQANIIIEGQRTTKQSHSPRISYDPQTGFPTGDIYEAEESFF